MKKIKLAVFDLDGTLLNTINDIADSCNFTLEKHGYPTHSVQTIQSFVGYGVRNLVKSLLPEEVQADNEQVESMFLYYQSYYNQNMKNKTRLYDGVEELLEKLINDGVKIAVLSNKLDKDTKEVVEYYLPNLTDLVLGQREGVPIKPDSTALLEIIDFFGVLPQQTVMIGDSEADVKTAIAANVKPIAVTWGFRTKEQLVQAGATVVVDTMNELYEEVK